MATKYRETHRRFYGSDWNIDLTITRTDENGVVTPFTGLNGATIVSTVKHRDTNAQMWQGTKAAGNITVTNDSLGKIRVAVPVAAQTLFTNEDRLYNADVKVTLGGVTEHPKRWYLGTLRTES
jgi:hypothetical protein